jgi:23S rRNA (pseudouridine1915-N3)-methyltransferase
MRYVAIAPWKLDARGPLAGAVKLYEERIAATHRDALQLVLPAAQPEGEKDATQFLIRECTKKRSDGWLLVCLDESGKTCDSEAFAARLGQAAAQGHKGVAFCLGGAYGLPQELAQSGPVELLSLSPLTLAHELALTVLLEQVYRAQCILARHPYHHAQKSALWRSLSGARGRA